MSKSGKEIKINPELKKALLNILGEDPKIDQEKLVERIKEKRINGLP